MEPEAFLQEFEEWKNTYLAPSCRDKCQSKCCKDTTLTLRPDEEIRVFGHRNTLQVEPRRFRLDGDCPQYSPETGLCKIYEDRPHACQNFPFDVKWDSPVRVRIDLGCEFSHQ